MKKYKFILTLPYDVKVDSQYEIHGHMSWPNWSQADPVFYRGLFDSPDEARAYATEFQMYKYILKYENGPDYDSFEDEAGNGAEFPGCYISIFDAEDAACRDLDISPGQGHIVHPSFTVEKVEEADPDNEVPAGVYKYCLHYEGECLLDSITEYGEYFATPGEAMDVAALVSSDYDIETDQCDYELEPVEILDIQILEVDDFD